MIGAHEGKRAKVIAGAEPARDEQNLDAYAAFLETLSDDFRQVERERGWNAPRRERKEQDRRKRIYRFPWE